MNQISQGTPRLLPQHRGGAPAVASAADELAAELDRAVLASASGASAAEVRRITTITSRADLRAAALAETTTPMGAAPPVRWEPTPATARHWADLDATQFARLRAPQRREDALEAIAANLRQVTSFAAALQDRSPALALAAARYNEELARSATASVQRATEHSALQPTQAPRENPLNPGPETETPAEVKTHHPAAPLLRSRYADAAVRGLVQDGDASQSAAQAAMSEIGRQSPLDSTPDRIMAAAAAAAMAQRRTDDSRAVAKVLETPAHDHHRPRTSSDMHPPSDRLHEAPETERLRASLRRPVDPDELPSELLRRYVVTRPALGILDKGRTEFTFRGGARDGHIAFADLGKHLSTSTQDADVIRSMVKVAATKGWDEVTVGGSADFRRLAWLEARLAGLRVHGYEARDADLKRLAELSADQSPVNTLSLSASHRSQRSVEDEGRRAAAAQQQTAFRAAPDPTLSDSQGPAEGPHDPRPASRSSPGVDSAHRKMVLEGMESLLTGRGYGKDFVEATLGEVAMRMQQQRVHVGQLVNHGPAPFQHVPEANASYFITLRDAQGDHTVWGKALQAAMEKENFQPGDPLVLTNTGRHRMDVPVRPSRPGGRNGAPTMAAVLNDWSVQRLDKVSLLVHQGAPEQVAWLPSLRVADPASTRLRPPDDAERVIRDRQVGRGQAMDR